MRCPSCRESFKDKVVDSRTTDGGEAIRRRRQCLVCGRRFTTKERIEGELRITVIKRNGDRVPYDRQKIIHGLRHACYKLPIDDSQIERVVDRIEEDIFERHDKEVHSDDIGECVVRRLRELNAVAYVRFMSVFRKFNDVTEFVEEIQSVRELAAATNPDQGALFDD